jgi:hypothetical protein
MSNHPGLPGKCCANCGFLYGLGYNAVDRANALFDPDLIRDPTYPDHHAQTDGAFLRGYLTSLPYTVRRIWEEAGAIHASPPEPTHYTWATTRSINCYHSRFRPLRIASFYQNRPLTEDELEDRQANYLPIEWDEVDREIRRDKSDCTNYFLYHPGFTAADHVTLQLEEKRFEQTQSTADSLNRATWQMTNAAWVSAIFAVVSVIAAGISILVSLASNR